MLTWNYENTIGAEPKKHYWNNQQIILFLRTKLSNDLNSDRILDKSSCQKFNAPDGRQYQNYHTWQKPNPLAERLIEHSTNLNDIIIDPFAGTGTFVKCGSGLGRQASGCDNNEEMIAIAKERGCLIKDIE